MVALSGRGWQLAPCLRTLFEETDRLYPNRSEASDGTIGDAAHRARPSDHNPEDDPNDGVGTDWVTAADVTHDPAHGCNVDVLVARIVARRDPRVDYLIRNGRICRSFATRGAAAWVWTPYGGSNPHTKHLHISVRNTRAARDDLAPWWGANPQELTMANIADIITRLDRLEDKVEAVHGVIGTAVIEGRELDDDVPENLAAEVDELRVNVRALGAGLNALLKAAGLPLIPVDR